MDPNIPAQPTQLEQQTIPNVPVQFIQPEIPVAQPVPEIPSNPNSSKTNPFIKIINIIIALYLFILALIYSFTAFLTFAILLTQNKLGFGWYQTALFAALHVFAFLIFIISKKRYTIVPWILGLILAWSVGTWIYFRSFSTTDLASIFLYGIPIAILLLLKHFKKNNQPNPAGINDTTTSSIPLSSTEKQPYWRRESSIIFFLVIFWPVGVILMWKYAKWRRWAKELITFLLLLGILPTVFLWSTYGLVRGFQIYDNIFNRAPLNKSKAYECKTLNNDWSKCVNDKDGFSFEYPVKWNYMEYSDSLYFSPSKDVLNNYLITFNSTSWDDQAAAKDFANGIAGISKKDKISVDGLYATKEKTEENSGVYFDGVILNGKTTYQFLTTFTLKDFIKNTKFSIKNEELESIFDHMLNSFTLGNKTVVVSPTPTLALSPTSTLTANWKIYTNLKYRYSLKYPPNWEVSESSESSFLYPAESDVLAKRDEEAYEDNPMPGAGIMQEIEVKTIKLPLSETEVLERSDPKTLKMNINGTEGLYYGVIGAPISPVYFDLPINDSSLLRFTFIDIGVNVGLENKKYNMNVETATEETFKQIISTLKFTQ